MLRLYFNHAWGSVRTESRSFSAEDGEVLLAGTGEKSKLPLFGFQLPADDYAIAEWQGDGARLFPPPAAKLEQSLQGDPFLELSAEALQRDGARAFLPMKAGTSVRIREGDQLLTVTLEDQKERAGWDKQKAAFMLLFMVLATIGLPLVFLTASPDPTLVNRALEDARVKQGLPAKPEPLNLKPAPENANEAGVQDAADAQGETGSTVPAKATEKRPTHVVLPASVR